jgi:hypothetical protein
MTTTEMSHLALQIGGWGAVGIVGIVVLLYCITRFTGISISPDELAGRSYWGFKVRFPPDSVTDVVQTRYQGVRYLWVSSSETSRQLCVILLGVRVDKYVDDLSHLLGTEHKLTQWFSSNA